MKKKRLWIYSTAFLAAAVMVAFVLFLLTEERRQAERRVTKPFPERQAREVYLYFAAGRGEALAAEKHRIEDSDDPVELADRVLKALLKGPLDRNLAPAIPSGTTCRALYLMPDGVAYADFSAALKENHPGGSEAELITIYSIVNSLTLNVEEIKAVKILIDGREEKTMAGHIDLRQPFEANIRIIQ